MDAKSYLIFSLDNSQYGIEAKLVKEVFALPEITSVPECPADIMGILNLRGDILPIMHLGLRLGAAKVSCQISDQIVVIDWGGRLMGIVVDQVQEMLVIESEDILSRLDYGRVKNINAVFIAGIAKVESELIVLFDPETLVREPERVVAMIWEHTEGLTIADTAIADLSDDESSSPDAIASAIGLSRVGSFYDYFPQISNGDREILQRRTENLRFPLVNLTDSTGLSPIAIVTLGGESFGIDLSTVKEFTSIRNLTRIPCCPSHIVGNMNLRGEIVTLVDIRNVLHLRGSPIQIGSQTVIVQVKDIVAGLPVDSVSDVMYVNPDEIKPIPIALIGGSSGYLQGTINLLDQPLGVLNLLKLLTGEELVVDETI